MFSFTKFTESNLEATVIDLLNLQGYNHKSAKELERNPEDIVLQQDFMTYLTTRYPDLTTHEVYRIMLAVIGQSVSSLYEDNRLFIRTLADGLIFKRDDGTQQDLFIELIDYTKADKNIYRFVTQLEIRGSETRIPDGILYINGLPLVVFEFKTAIEEDCTIHDAYVQLTTRYKRDIPELFKYNAFLVISDGVNNKAGSMFSPYEFFYGWRRGDFNDTKSADGIDSLYTMINGLFNKDRLRDVIQNFIYFPDSSKRQEKVICRYPQYYAARKLYNNILEHKKPLGDGKGGTYFGATGCGKSYTMLFLTRLLMRSREMSSPTIVLITDRTDLDVQLAGTFTNAKTFIGDDVVQSVNSREDLRFKLRGRESGGVFLTTVHKFNEDTELLSERTNIVCISDEAHRSQINLDKKFSITDLGVTEGYGFAYHLHQSLPNATYVGFTGTPIDKTMAVFGEVVDKYTMNESVKDEITVRIVYEGRAAKVLLKNTKLKEVEEYYAKCLAEGASEYQVYESKRESSRMEAILGDEDVLGVLAKDFIEHYETRVKEGATVSGKAIFVAPSRQVAYKFYKQLLLLRPAWGVAEINADHDLTIDERKQLHPIETVKMVMTRNKDDEADLWHLIGNSDYQKDLDRQFKQEKSNFKIAIVVDMWLTGFDVPFLDTIYLFKPIKKHSLIQTISRVNRRFKGKDKGLVVDYIGIKKYLNEALRTFGDEPGEDFEDVDKAINIVRDQLYLLDNLFHTFDSREYFEGSPKKKLDCLNRGAEFVQVKPENEVRFMELAKKLKEAYNLCCSTNAFSTAEVDRIHFYTAIRSIIYKLTKGEAPDAAQMNARVAQLVEEAIVSEGVEEIFKINDSPDKQIDLFSAEYIDKINSLKLPNTKIKILERLLKQGISEFKKVNKVKAIDFSKKLQAIVDKYNERNDDEALAGEVLDELASQITDLLTQLREEQHSHEELGIDYIQKAFYDILQLVRDQHKFEFPEDKMMLLAGEVKAIVEDKQRYIDWNEREDIKAELKADLVLKLHEYGYPPVMIDSVYKQVFEQAENFKKYA